MGYESGSVAPGIPPADRRGQFAKADDTGGSARCAGEPAGRLRGLETSRSPGDACALFGGTPTRSFRFSFPVILSDLVGGGAPEPVSCLKQSWPSLSNLSFSCRSKR